MGFQNFNIYKRIVNDLLNMQELNTGDAFKTWADLRDMLLDLVSPLYICTFDILKLNPLFAPHQNFIGGSLIRAPSIYLPFPMSIQIPVSVIKVHKLPRLIRTCTWVFSTSKSRTSSTLIFLNFDKCS